MHEELTRKLQETARASRTIHYGDIAPMLGLDMGDPQDRLRIGETLGEISKVEHESGRPLLSVVVTQKENERPGAGFFQLAQDLGMMAGLDNETFFIKELTRAYEYWAAH
jgi:hypothetical protein